MKIRNDYVSNSSSSSFIVVGNRLDKVSLDDLESLNPDESIFLILKGYGCDGDYIFELTPALLMDCDMRHIDFNSPKLTKVKGRYVVGEGGYVSSAKGSTSSDEFDVLTAEAMRKDGVPLDGMRMYRFNKDWDTPSASFGMIDALKRYTGTGF